MCICICICICICMCICIRVYIYIYTCITILYVYVCVYIYIYIYIHLLTCVIIQINIIPSYITLRYHIAGRHASTRQRAPAVYRENGNPVGTTTLAEFRARAARARRRKCSGCATRKSGALGTANRQPA